MTREEEEEELEENLKDVKELKIEALLPLARKVLSKIDEFGYKGSDFLHAIGDVLKERYPDADAADLKKIRLHIGHASDELWDLEERTEAAAILRTEAALDI